jgi:hypothetical protein
LNIWPNNPYIFDLLDEGPLSLVNFKFSLLLKISETWSFLEMDKNCFRLEKYINGNLLMEQLLAEKIFKLAYTEAMN